MLKIVKIVAVCALTFLGINAYAQDNGNTNPDESQAVKSDNTNAADSAQAAAEPSDTAEAPANTAAAPKVMTGEDIVLPDDTAAPANPDAVATDSTATGSTADTAAAATGSTADTAAATTGSTADTAAATTGSTADTTAASAMEEPEVMTDALLDKRLREVSTHVDTLKEDTFTTKSRLLLLREEVLQRSVSGSRLQIRHKNDMGGQYELVQIYYALDNEPVFSKQDMTGALDDLEDEVIYDRMLAPGQHQLTVLYVYKGKPWGVFRYMKDYTFRVQSGYDFNVEEGKASELVVTAAEKDGVFIPYEDRPSVTYDYEQFDLMPSTMLDETAEASAEVAAEGAE